QALPGVRHVAIPPNLIPAGCEHITPELLPLVELTQAAIDAIAASVPGGAANVQDIYPLAPLQEGIWFHHLLAKDGDPYLLSVNVRFDRRSHLEAFVAALNATIARHDILRTAIVWEGLQEPLQVVWREAPLVVEEVALAPADGADGEVLEQLKGRFDPRHHRLDVSQAPMMRLYVAWDAANDCWLGLLLSHHLITDHTTTEQLTA